MEEPPARYSPTAVAEFLHRLPHINILLRKVNSTFNPYNEAYLEALGLYAAVPALWLILTLFILLVYLLTRCCDRNPRRKRSITPWKWILGLLAVVCCGSVAVGLYGNDDVHNGLVQVMASVASINEVFLSARNETVVAEQTLNRQVQSILKNLQSRIESSPGGDDVKNQLVTVISGMISNTSLAVRSTKSLVGPLKGAILTSFIDVLHMAEIIRWPVTMAVLSLLLVFCFILLFGVVRHARGALIAFSVFGLFAVITTYALSAVYLAGSIALGDFCVAPDPFVEKVLSGQGPSIQREMAHYYIQCDRTATNPLYPRLQSGLRASEALVSGLTQINNLVLNLPYNVRTDELVWTVNLTKHIFNKLEQQLSCQGINRNYQGAIHGICDLGLMGLLFMLASAACAGILFTLLVWIDSHAWIYIRKRPDYLQVDEQDPFLAGGPGGPLHQPHHPAAMSSLGRRSQGNGRHAREEKSGDSSHHSDRFTTMLGPNNGQYATLSKQCKTLESADFY
ncbi:protein tweety isoform X2 [Neocloeon triangulifer]|uniref:protein tweety isoform X2 n=1 Tax=Neocloeon triangulifer TaxID=2078957 RepID=UPI00286F02A2|nr:protein tweety isoform X2 [Neocloeon triangulifer]